jgi:hypothetical protein
MSVLSKCCFHVDSLHAANACAHTHTHACTHTHTNTHTHRHKFCQSPSKVCDCCVRTMYPESGSTVRSNSVSEGMVKLMELPF